jgi:predicted histone-like DNA-binding protein
VSFDKNSEKWAYVLQADLYNKLSQSKVIQEAALRSGIAKGAINAAWDAIGEVIKAWATEGHSVAVPGLGTMRFGLRSKSIADVNKVGSDLITSRRVIFTPNVEIKEELAKTSINITCYDRNGDVVKRVTSSDDGTVEDNDGGDDNPGGGDNGGGSSSSGSQTGGDNSGSQTGGDNGGSNGGNSQPQTPTENAPNFSGATQLEESTQVTMTGPTGASIFYTLDGSTPTDQSLEYEGPITLSETTVVKAIAIKDGVSSSVTSRTYTKGTNAGGGGDEEGNGDID